MSVYYNGKGKEIKTDLSASEIVKVITQGCPTFFITSDTAYADVTKENKSSGVCKFVSGGGEKFELPVQFKLQGNSSLVYPKHNFIIGFGNSAAIWQKLPHRSWFSWRQLQLWFRMMCSRSSTGEQRSSCHPEWIWMRSLRCFVLFRHYDRLDQSPQLLHCLRIYRS